MKKTIALAAFALALAACGPKTGTTSSTSSAATSTKDVKSTATHESPKLAPGRVDPASVPMESKMLASRNSKTNAVYSNALAAIYAPEDQKEYSAYSDYGWSKARPYKTYGDMPAGWWVYSAPYWVIWDLKNGQRGSE